MRYVELFAGAGGLSMGLEAAGMHPVAHAEIEPHARAVLRHHWPDTPLHGDVTQVDWEQYAGQVDLVAGGSPCQDLSVAGKRAGLAGARSGLFYELIRAWDETGATYCLWENVDGARSSNNGEDFAAVLSAFVGNPVAVPRDKRGHARWPGAGVVAGSTGVAAWRVLDLQHFGPPQRRRRIFVVAARTGGADPAEILALSEGVCGHPSPREQSRQGVARGAAGGAGGGGCRPVAFTTTQTPKVGGDVALTLEAASRSGGGQTPAVLAFKPGQSEAAGGTFVTEGLSPTLQGANNGSTQVPAVLALDVNGSDTAQTLRGFGHGWQGQHNSTNAVLAFHCTQDPISGAVSPALGRTTEGMGVVCTTGDVTHALTHEGADASEDGTGRGTPIVADAVLAFDTTQTPITFTERGRGDALSVEARRDGTVNCIRSPNGGRGGIGSTDAVLAFEPRYWLRENKTGGAPSDLVKVDASIGKNGDATPHIVCLASGQANAEVVRDGVPTLNTIHEQPIIVGTLDVHDSVKWGSHQWVAQNKAITAAGRPRRLTPLECERLMGWPDRHTAQGVREDGTAYALSDTARYRLCGNGVGTPVATWIGRRLAEAHSL